MKWWQNTNTWFIWIKEFPDWYKSLREYHVKYDNDIRHITNNRYIIIKSNNNKIDNNINFNSYWCCTTKFFDKCN